MFKKKNSETIDLNLKIEDAVLLCYGLIKLGDRFDEIAKAGGEDAGVAKDMYKRVKNVILDMPKEVVMSACAISGMGLLIRDDDEQNKTSKEEK